MANVNAAIKEIRKQYPDTTDEQIQQYLDSRGIQANASEIGKPKSVGGFAGNIGKDLGTNIQGLMSLPGVLYKSVTQPQTLPETGAAIGKGLFNEYKDLVTHPIDTAYEKPVSTVLDVLPFLQLGKAGLVGKAGKASKAAEIAGSTGKAGEASRAIRTISEAGKVSETAGKAGLLKKLGISVEKTGKALPKKGLGQPAAVEMFESKFGPVGDTLTEYKLNTNSINKLNDVLGSKQQAFDDIAIRSGAKIPVGDVLQEGYRKVAELRQAGPEAGKQLADRLEKELTNISEKHGTGMVDIKDLTKTRKSYDEITKNFKGDDLAKGSSQIMRETIQDSIRKNTQGVTSGGKNIAELGQELNKLYELEPIINRAAQRSEVGRLVNLTRLVGFGSGGAVFGGLPGAIAGTAIAGALNSPKTIQMASKGLQRVGTGIQGLEGAQLPGVLGKALSGSKSVMTSPYTYNIARQIPQTQNKALLGDQAGNPQNYNVDNGTYNQSATSIPSTPQGGQGSNLQDPEVRQLVASLLAAAVDNPDSAPILNAMATQLAGQDLSGLGIGSTGGGFDVSGLSTTAAKEYNDTETALNLLDSLETEMNADTFAGVTGPITGRIRGKNPYDVKAGDFDAFSKVVKQIIGKGLEGGVLRKEDEAKYEYMIPNIKDTPAKIDSKMKRLKQALDIKQQTLQETYGGTTGTTEDVSSLIQLLGM